MNRQRSFGRIGATQLILLVAIAAALGLWAGSRWLAVPQAPELQTAVMYPAAQSVADFTLQRADGKSLTRDDFKGVWTVAFFGFTHCPDICPTTLATFKQVWKELAAAKATDRVQFVFVSVDPERDSPAQLASYVGFFDKEFIAATGADEQLTALTRSLGLVYARIPDVSGSYTVDHSASVVLIDPQARRAGLFRPPFVAEAIGKDLLALAGSADAAFGPSATVCCPRRCSGGCPGWSTWRPARPGNPGRISSFARSRTVLTSI